MVNKRESDRLKRAKTPYSAFNKGRLNMIWHIIVKLSHEKLCLKENTL